MPKALWNGAVLAESERVETVEGNTYFPPDAIRKGHLVESDTHTTCAWKGVASYCDVVVDGKVNKDAAWFYPDTRPEANHIKDYIAFWHGVTIEP